MSSRARILVIVAAVVVVVVAFIIISPGRRRRQHHVQHESHATPRRGARGASAGTTRMPETTTGTPAAAPTGATVKVVNAKPEGGISASPSRRATHQLHGRVRHGGRDPLARLRRQEGGRPAARPLQIPAKIDGRFEVELEDTGPDRRGRGRAVRRRAGRRARRWSPPALVAPTPAHGLVGRRTCRSRAALRLGGRRRAGRLVRRPGHAVAEPQLQDAPRGSLRVPAPRGPLRRARHRGVRLRRLRRLRRRAGGDLEPRADVHLRPLLGRGPGPLRPLRRRLCAFNPGWRSARAAGWGARSGVAGSEPLPYPSRLGRWPAAVGLIFAWVELAYTNRDDPSSSRSWRWPTRPSSSSGWACTGSSRGASAPTRSGSTSALRPPRAAALARRRADPRPPSAARLRSTPAQAPSRCLRDDRHDHLRRLLAGHDLELDGRTCSTSSSAWPQAEQALEATLTVGIVVMSCSFACSSGWAWPACARSGRADRARELPRFAHSLVPIALAYLVAHYFSLFAFQGQAIASLASDPLGDGSDLLGTATRPSTTPHQRDRHLVRPGRRARPRPRRRTHPRARPRAGRLPRPGRRDALAVLDAGRHGRLHVPRPLAALGGGNDAAVVPCALRPLVASLLYLAPVVAVVVWLGFHQIWRFMAKRKDR